MANRVKQKFHKLISLFTIAGQNSAIFATKNKWMFTKKKKIIQKRAKIFYNIITVHVGYIYICVIIKFQSNHKLLTHPVLAMGF
jgi:hypothetical protein